MGIATRTGQISGSWKPPDEGLFSPIASVRRPGSSRGATRLPTHGSRAGQPDQGGSGCGRSGVIIFFLLLFGRGWQSDEGLVQGETPALPPAASTCSFLSHGPGKTPPTGRCSGITGTRRMWENAGALVARTDNQQPDKRLPDCWLEIRKMYCTTCPAGGNPPFPRTTPPAAGAIRRNLASLGT